MHLNKKNYVLYYMMSEENINIAKKNECFNNQEEANNLFMKNIISKFVLIDKFLNFIIDNYPKNEPQMNIATNIMKLFYKFDKLFYDKLCSIKEKIDLFLHSQNIYKTEKDNEEKETINEINNEDNNLLNFYNFSKLKEFCNSYCEYIKEIGNIFIEYSDNILNEIKINENDFDKIIENNEPNVDRQKNNKDFNPLNNEEKKEMNITIQNNNLNNADNINIKNIDVKEKIINIEKEKNKNYLENNEVTNINNDINFNEINIDVKNTNIEEQKENEIINIKEIDHDEKIIIEENKEKAENSNFEKEKKEENIIFNNENSSCKIENEKSIDMNEIKEIKEIKNREEKCEGKKDENILENKEDLEKNINIESNIIERKEKKNNEEEKFYNNLQKEEIEENIILDKEKNEHFSIVSNDTGIELVNKEVNNSKKNNIIDNTIEDVKNLKINDMLDIKTDQSKIKESINSVVLKVILDKEKIKEINENEKEIIKNNLEKISEEIINSIIKTELVGQKIFLKIFIKNIEKNIIDSLIGEIIKEINDEKERNKQDKNYENIEDKYNNIIEGNEKEKKGETKKEEIKETFKEDNSYIKENEIQDEVKNINENNINKNDKTISEIYNNNNKIIQKSEEQIKNEENNKENLNNSFLESNIPNIPNIDLLLGDMVEEEENININKNLLQKQEIINNNDEKHKIDEINKVISKDKEYNLEEDKQKIEKEKKDEKKILDEGIKVIIELIIDNVINNKDNQNDIEKTKNEEKGKINVIEQELDDKIKNENDKKDKEKNNNNEKIDDNLNLINPEQTIKNLINLSEKNLLTNAPNALNNININENNIIKDEIDKIKNNDTNPESKGNEKKKKDDEFDFDLDEEMDIDLIIKNKSISEANINKQKEIDKEKEKEKEDLTLEKKSFSESMSKKQKDKEKIYDVINKENKINNKEKNEKDLIIKLNTFSQPNIVINKQNILKKDIKDINIIIKNEPKLTLPLLPSIRDKEIYIESAIKKMFSKSILLQEEIKTLKEILFKNESVKHFFSFFINFLLKRINKKIKFLSDFKNFKIFVNIIQNICIKEDRAYIFDSIMEISQYIKYENYYLYQFIRKKIKHFENNEFWKALINNLLIISLNDRVKYIINRENQKKEKISMTERGQKKTPFWKDFFLNVFTDNNNSKDDEEFINQNEYEKNSDFIIYSLNYSKNINNYQKLNYELKKELDTYCKKSLEKILFKTIKNMSYFGFNNNDIKIVILDFCARFEFSNESKEYFINLIDCYELHNYKILKKNFSLKEKNSEINDKSYIIILSNIFIFLTIKEGIKLFLLNKQFNIKNNLKKEIFAKFLRQKNLPLSNRLIIWEEILNISKLKLKYIYSEIKESTLKRLSSGELQKGTRLYNNNETITKDVKRTAFLVDKEENQNKLSNILRCLNLLNPSIGYYQGISYVAAFFLQMLDFNEEKTFFYMLSLETQTDYKNLFLNNLEILNDNFRIFDKIIEIGLPDVYLHLNKLRVTSDFYAPSWFLTIFMCISPLFDKKDISKFCILVFEKFILDGWEAVFIAGFTALKYCYRELLKINETAIYNYLTNDFADQVIFKNSIFDKAESDFINNSEFINNILISLVNNICRYEKRNKDEGD